ncbi:probably inactive receptor-like protein kinase At5g41680 [Diospyros lotus]|uniref:probably inactive receptor-like protein kinase At5g41680 n=1 Tax=Diospyros lotus TaxID=55363 RepID=UPI002257CD67|nr:probably inactive receptor-like protein kinase At5g41680 [Diospyros lotus]
MRGRKCFVVLLTFFLLIEGGQFSSDSDSLFSFIRAVDPENVLRIDPRGLSPHPCSRLSKGVTCNVGGTIIRAIRLENLNLSGTIDAESLCRIPNLQVLSLARNQIQGSIPESILNCTSLTYLNLSNNLLNGSAPIGLAKLKTLRRLDISNNQFTTSFPDSRWESGHSNNFSVAEDGSPPKSPPQNGRRGAKIPKSFDKWPKLIPLVVAMTLFFLFICYINMKAFKLEKEKAVLRSLAMSPAKSPPPKDFEEVKPDPRNTELVFFVNEEERFTMEDLLEAAADLQSQSFCSSLYKVKIKSSALFAVKRLKKLQVSFEEFEHTMRTVGNLKHPNVLPLVCYSLSDEEKLLIYRYQINGSLLSLQENYIAGKRDFPWKLRLSIAVGIARGLEFIYQRSDDREIIPHGNIKPSNILLNETEVPLISEYSLSKFADSRAACLFGYNNGYTAPEKTPSEEGDVFSFGVILLELLTGKSVEKSGLDLPKWVKSIVREEWTGEVFDKEIRKIEMYAFSLLNISLKCVAHFPENRPSIAEVLEKIEEVLNSQEDHPPSPVSSVEYSSN